MSERLTGARVARVEDARLLTGHATFTADVSPAGTLRGVFARSPFPHARVTGIDVTAARAMPGVQGVFTHLDLAAVLPPLRPPEFPELRAPAHTALAGDAVRFVGDPVVLVVADTLAQAEDAAELVEITYEAQPVVTCAAQALDPDAGILWPALGSNVVHEQSHTVGDPDTMLRDAAMVVRTRIDQHRVAQAPMECRASVADFDRAAGALTFTTSHQSPNQVRTLLASVLGLDTGRVRVVCPFVGGSFGQKSGLAREDAALAAASMLLGRPVAWHETRTENLLAAGHSREAYADVEMGFTDDGRLLALRVHLVTDLGAYPQLGYPAAGYSNLVRALLPAAYRLTHFAFSATMVVTNKATYVPYRGPWEMETFLRERVLDLAARRLGIGPAELRRRNLLTRSERERGSCLGVDLHGVTVDETLAFATELLAREGWHEQAAATRATGRLVGVGLATYVEPAPVSPSLLRAMGVQAVSRTTQEARLRLDPDGGVTLFTSQQPHGQGHETTLAQLTADVLDLPIASIRVVWGDTDLVPFNLVGTGGSRAATLASGAVLDAAQLLRMRLLELAAERLEIAPEDLELHDGAVVPRDAPSRGIVLADLAASTTETPEVLGSFLSADGTWSQATHCAMVEVDADTGAVEILRYVVVEDCGPPINPAIVDGQVRGGVAQGVASVLHEHAAYDDDGQPRAATFLDYLVPSAVEVPPIEIHHLHHHPVGAADGGPVPFRGVGEGGALGSPAALVSAIEDAVAHLGIEITTQHLPPARLYDLIHRARDDQGDRGGL
jgi:carbon-monoxide dehydrogenase large subunit